MFKQNSLRPGKGGDVACFDSHTHTYLSNHGEGTVQQLVAAALARGLAAIAITEHLPLPAGIDEDGDFAMDADKLQDYLDAVAKAREGNPGIEIICGCEVDWLWGGEGYILERIAPFELLLGSVHLITDENGGAYPFDHPGHMQVWEKWGEQRVWDKYLELWLQALRSDVPFDVMTHPDLPKKLGFKPKFDTREYYAAMAEAASRRGVMIEVNTSGLRRMAGEVYPALGLLRAFREAGVQCTIGSDAHCPADVARDFDLGYAAMFQAGYTHVTRPCRGKGRIDVPIGDALAAWRAGRGAGKA